MLSLVVVSLKSFTLMPIDPAINHWAFAFRARKVITEMIKVFSYYIVFG